MPRATLSLVLVAAILIVAAAGVCAACPSASKPDCCDEHGRCKESKGPVQKQCPQGTPDSTTVEHAFQIQAAAPVVVDVARVEFPISFAQTDETASPYSPPDLWLLNSVLTI